MTKPDYRALCAELLDELDLAQPVAEEPTDEEIIELMPQQMRDDLTIAAKLGGQ